MGCFNFKMYRCHDWNVLLCTSVKTSTRLIGRICGVIRHVAPLFPIHRVLAFFSDVFILLPLLLLSIERFLKSGQLGLFIIMTAISFANNFYFAYYQVLMGLIYYNLAHVSRTS